MDFVQLVSTIGFPIATVIALGYFYNGAFRELSNNIRENTEVLLQIREHFRGEDGNGDK